MTSEVKGHFEKKLHTSIMKSTEKVSFRYLKLFCIYTHMKFTFWPQRSKLALEVKGHKVNLFEIIQGGHLPIFIKIDSLYVALK